MSQPKSEAYVIVLVDTWRESEEVTMVAETYGEAARRVVALNNGYDYHQPGDPSGYSSMHYAIRTVPKADDAST